MQRNYSRDFYTALIFLSTGTQKYRMQTEHILTFEIFGPDIEECCFIWSTFNLSGHFKYAFINYRFWATLRVLYYEKTGAV